MGVRDTRGNFPSVQFDFLRVHFVDIPGHPEMNRKKEKRELNFLCSFFFSKLNEVQEAHQLKEPYSVSAIFDVIKILDIAW